MRRALLAGLLTLLGCLAAPVAGALATPTVKIESPSSGTVTSQQRPVFAGGTTDTNALDPVTVSVYGEAGLVESVEATPEAVSGEFSAQLPSNLPAGSYSVVAEQHETLTGQTGASHAVDFRVVTEAPAVTLATVSSPTNDSTPSFTGTASERTPVTIQVHEGASALGAVVATAHATGTGGSWASTGASPQLSDGTYTAVAEQESSVGFGPGFSQGRTFTVITAKPTVSLNAVSSPTNDTTPSFSGSGSEKTTVTILIFKGSTASGPVVAEAEAGGTGGGWSSGGASPALAEGTYTARAAQESAFGNGAGYSQERTFTVITAKPTVSLEAVPSPTSDSTPAFSGSASDTTTVTIQIFKGGSASGSPVASAHASGTGGGWSSSGASPALADGTYTARAEQSSSVGNGTGFSEERTFTLDTKPPKVELNPIASPTNNTTPSFSGYASDTTTVTIYVSRDGSSGEPAKVEAGGTGGNWSSGPLSGALEEGSYKAVAVQKSSHGTGEGKSEPIAFSIRTAPPKVTLNSIKTPSGDTSPTFTGSASDTEAVSIVIHEGGATGPEVSSATATGTGGSWSSGHASPALQSGEYTAVARQRSSLGNADGSSEPIHFTIDTSSPTVTLESITTPSNNANPAFKGTATDTTPVVVHIYDSGHNEVATASGSPSGGGWKSGSLSKALGTGSYTAEATEASSLGNPAGASAPIGFAVNTQSPQVTLDQPPLRSNDKTPSFTGTASDTTNVTIKILKGGSLVTTVEASGTGGAWASSPSSALADGSYTAIAVQPSSVGNPAGSSQARGFTIDTSAPEVTLNAPAVRTKDTTPSFSGTAEDTTTVTIRVFAGSSPGGTPVATLHATGTGAGWTSGEVTSPLAEGTYTAVAEQESSLPGNAAGVSNAATFKVETKSPTVTLAPVSSPSNNLTPTFSGSASDTTKVVVQVFREGTQVATAETAPSGGHWTLVSPSLPAGTSKFTAIATQQSFVGNPEGHSNEVAFEVNTLAPIVGLEAIKTPSNNRVPSFGGTATDTGKVVVHVLKAGSEVASAEATPSGGKWKSGPVAPELAAGESGYTAYATQASSLGNEAGKSASIEFTVNTKSPTVELSAITTPSNNREPEFSGTASDSTPVTVTVFAAAKGKIETVSATVSATTHTWTTGPIKALPNTSGPEGYAAVAEQSSSIGNAPGKSPERRFIVDPGAPTVAMNAPKAQINTATPSFSGTATGSLPVNVAICRMPLQCTAGAGQWNTVSTGGGFWTTAPSTPLPDGEYDALASERSLTERLGADRHYYYFTIDTVPPHVTLTSPVNGAVASGGSETVQGLAGTAPHDVAVVTVELFAGAAIGAGQTPLRTLQVGAPAGAWSASLTGLAPGAYTVQALQSDAAGNRATSNSATFTEQSVAPAKGPTAAFTWYPSKPHTGETVSLVSNSSDSASPITGYGWNLSGSAFAAGGQTQTIAFATPGSHLVQLRVADSSGLSSIAAEQIPVTYPLMRPFPTVRIVTTRALGRVRLKLLSVQAPAGSTVLVTCSGKGCPQKSASRTVRAGKAATAPLAFPAFEHSLAPGVQLQIRIAKAGRVGKYTRFAIRRGKLPLRTDACLEAMDPKPVECPV
jgi:large repetitive protein